MNEFTIKSEYVSSVCKTRKNNFSLMEIKGKEYLVFSNGSNLIFASTNKANNYHKITSFACLSNDIYNFCITNQTIYLSTLNKVYQLEVGEDLKVTEKLTIVDPNIKNVLDLKIVHLMGIDYIVLSTTTSLINIDLSSKTVRVDPYKDEMYTSIWSHTVLKMPIVLLGSYTGQIHVASFTPNALTKLFSMLGHTDSITQLDGVNIDESSFLISSSSKDGFMRIWKFTIEDSEILDDSIYKTANLKSGDGTEGAHLNCRLDSVIVAHYKWVNGCYFKKPFPGETLKWPIYLASVSNDCNLILWEQRDESQPWEIVQRFGSTGQHSVIWFSCLINSQFDRIFALGLRGNISIWTIDRQLTDEWSSSAPLLGHFEEISCVKWSRDPKNLYLLSSGYDKIVRLHAPLKEDSNKDTKTDSYQWFELGRPQVHGYEVNCIAPIDEFSYASGGDEKILRILQVPNDQHAIQQELGLSNLSTTENKLKPLSLPTRPFDEDELYRETLWPETKKLYAHALEVFSLDVNLDGTLICSASKATKQEHAFIVLWKRNEETNDWHEFQRLTHHTLTVVSLQFSQFDNGKMILSASRDRTWAVFKVEESSGLYQLYSKSTISKDSHSRIIWSAKWYPDICKFLTASRDKRAILWNHTPASEEKFTQLSSITFENPISSMTLLKWRDFYMAAFGFETGQIIIKHWSDDEEGASFASDSKAPLFVDLANSTYTVKTLDMKLLDAPERVLLASGDKIGLLRIFSINLSH